MSLILELLSKDNNRSDRKVLTDLIKEKKDFDELYRYIRANDNAKGSYASWAFTKKSDIQKDIILNYHDDLIKWLPAVETNGILRSMLRSVAQFEVPKNRETAWIDLSFKYLLDLDYEIAVKVHAMEICFQYCKRYPELKTELLSVIDAGFDNYAAALNARARSTRKRLAKLK